MLKQFERHYVRTNEDAKRAVDYVLEHKICGFDTETCPTEAWSQDGKAGLDAYKARIRLVQLAAGSRSYVIDLNHVTDVTPLKNLVMDGSVLIVGHNLIFENKFLLHHWGVWTERCFDTQLASQLFRVFVKRVRDTGEFPKGTSVEDKKHNLGVVAKRFLGVDVSKVEQKSDWSRPELTSEQIEYAHLDAEIMLPLYEVLSKRFVDSGMTRVGKIEFAAIPALAEMELTGWGFDAEAMTTIESEIGRRRERVGVDLAAAFPAKQTGIFTQPGINLNSPKQLKASFAEKFGIYLDKTKKSEVLQYLDPSGPACQMFPATGDQLATRRESLTPVVNALADFGSLKSMLKVCDELKREIHPVTGRIHPQYRQLGQEQGRSSTKEPNSQKIPRPDTWGPKSPLENFKHDLSFRGAFVPAPGNKLAICDYAGNQLRIVADQAGDPVMIDAFNRGDDLHWVTAEAVLRRPRSEMIKGVHRQMAKTWGFAFCFGVGAQKFMGQQLEDTRIYTPLDVCKQQRDAFFDVYKALKPWHRRISKKANADGYIGTPYGRKIFFHPENCANEDIYTEAINFGVCATEVDGMKDALGRLFREKRKRKLNAKFVAFVYDEIVLETSEGDAEAASALQQEIMKDSMQAVLRRVPAEVEGSIGTSWQDK